MRGPLQPAVAQLSCVCVVDVDVVCVCARPGDQLDFESVYSGDATRFRRAVSARVMGWVRGFVGGTEFPKAPVGPECPQIAICTTCTHTVARLWCMRH